MMSVSFVLLTILRLEVSAEGVFYRNLSGSEKAYLTVKRSDATPQGVAAFWLQPKAGRPVKSISEPFRPRQPLYYLRPWRTTRLRSRFRTFGRRGAWLNKCAMRKTG
jgi:hypothetical protein